MNRLLLINDLISRFKYKTYLEIGVFDAGVFFKIKCRNKIAVDPDFKIGKRKYWKNRLTNWQNLNARFIEKTSDDFFAQNGKLLKEVDISLVDGMHEFAFSLRDVENTLKVLNKDGVIIMHDCNPQSEKAAISFGDWKKRNCTGEWNGDVWKTIVYLRSVRKDLNVFVADCDQGLGIITKRQPHDKGLSFNSFETVDRLSYNDLSNNRKEYLNLKPASYLNEFFNSFK
jgi:hypothetical protein